MRLIIPVVVASLLCVSCASAMRPGINLMEARSLCITYFPGNDDASGSCSGQSHHDVCDAYIEPLPGFKDRQACLEHCDRTWKTLYQRFTGRECGPQVENGRDLCERYCRGSFPAGR